MAIKNIRGIINYNLDLKNFSRKNRKNPTSAEDIIWREILSRKKTGYRFLRQKPIDNFIVDFYCSKLLLVIEVDGNTHFRLRDKKYDFMRTCRLNMLGIEVIRYNNQEIITNLDGVYQGILKQIQSRVKNIF